MSNLTPWDTNAKEFDVHSAASRYEIDLTKLEFGVGANVMVAWPAVHAVLDSHRAHVDRPLHVVDFGCGTGGFAQQRDDRDDVVSGIDISREMLEIARGQTVRHIYYLSGAEALLRRFRHQDAVTANLVMNYLPEITTIGSEASNTLSPGGLFVFADLNPDYVRECLRRGIIYSDPIPPENARVATLNFASGAKQVTLWEQSEYEEAFRNFGFELASVTKPPLTQEFLELFHSKLDQHYPVEVPRYRVFAFKKLPDSKQP